MDQAYQKRIKRLEQMLQDSTTSNAKLKTDLQLCRSQYDTEIERLQNEIQTEVQSLKERQDMVPIISWNIPIYHSCKPLPATEICACNASEQTVSQSCQHHVHRNCDGRQPLIDLQRRWRGLVCSQQMT